MYAKFSYDNIIAFAKKQGIKLNELVLQNPKKFGEDDIKFAKEISSQGKKSLMPGEKIQKADKISKLASNRKSVHPPTGDAAQAKLTDRKVELIKNRNNRRREKERLLRRMFEK